MGRQQLAFLLCLGCHTPTDEPEAGEPPCGIETDTATCAVNFEPTWDEFYTRILAPGMRCGCHEPGGEAEHLGFPTSPQAYETLLDEWVYPRNAECSPLMHLFETGEMPPTKNGKSGLAEQDLCAIARWIEAGAAQ